jgi:hypothetical protein
MRQEMQYAPLKMRIEYSAPKPRATTPLPKGWRAYFDKKRQRSYYHNATSQQTVWTRPVSNSATTRAVLTPSRRDAAAAAALAPASTPMSAAMSVPMPPRVTATEMLAPSIFTEPTDQLAARQAAEMAALQFRHMSTAMANPPSADVPASQAVIEMVARQAIEMASEMADLEAKQAAEIAAQSVDSISSTRASAFNNPTATFVD